MDDDNDTTASNDHEWRIANTPEDTVIDLMAALQTSVKNAKAKNAKARRASSSTGDTTATKCTCICLVEATHLSPAEWEQGQDCLVHPIACSICGAPFGTVYDAKVHECSTGSPIETREEES